MLASLRETQQKPSKFETASTQASSFAQTVTKTQFSQYEHIFTTNTQAERF
jgi:hypothetical protein